jgi:hypothetical protein
MSFIPLAGVAFIVLVRQKVLPKETEIAAQTLAGYLGLLLVPLLLALAFRAWAKTAKPALPNWRNGLGLSSLLVLSAVWVSYTGLWWGNHTHAAWGRYYDPAWMGILFPCSLAACILAFALRGSARAMGISAALLMWAWLQSMVYSGTMNQLLRVLSQTRAQ